MRQRAVLVVVLSSLVLVARLASVVATVDANAVVTGSGWRSVVRDGHLHVATIQEFDAGGHPSPAAVAGLRPDDRITAIHAAIGTKIQLRSMQDLAAAERVVGPGERWWVDIEREESGTTRVLRLEVPPSSGGIVPGTFPSWLEFIVMMLIVPVTALATAGLIGLAKPEDDHAFVAALLLACFAALPDPLAIHLPAGLRELALGLWIAAQLLFFYLLMRFFLIFPTRSIIARRAPGLATALLVATTVVVMPWIAHIYISQQSFEATRMIEPVRAHSGKLGQPLVWLMCLIGISALATSVVSADNRDSRRRLAILLFGTVLAFAPTFIVSQLLLDMFVTGRVSWWISALVPAANLMFPLSFAYVVLRHRVFGIRLIVRKGLQYVFVSRTFLALEWATLFTLCLLSGAPLMQALVPDAPTVAVAGATAVVTLALVSGLQRVNTRIMPRIDRRFFREAYDARQMLTGLARSIRAYAGTPPVMIAKTIEEIGRSLHPATIGVFVREASGMYRRADGDNAGEMLASGTALGKLLDGAAADPHAIDVHPRDATLLGDDAGGLDRRLLQATSAELLLPLATQGRSLGFILLGPKLSEEPYSTEDRALLQAVADQLAIALDYAGLMMQAAEQVKLRREIEIAKQVQQQLFPQVQPTVATLEYCGFCRPARGVGGDYFDFLALGESQLGIALGDVSGKGISAALLMASLQALLRSHAPLRGGDVAHVVSDISRLLFDSTAANKYATFFYAVYHSTQRSLTYVNAGHNPPILLRPRSLAGTPSARVVGTAAGQVGVIEAAAHASTAVQRLTVGGPVIGMFPNATYQQETVQLSAGDVLAVCTDGIYEAVNAEDEEFGDDRVSAAVLACLGRCAAEIRDAVVEATDRHAGTAPQHDDMTIVVARVL
jgi:sigma-B regulation protein RsbU (phosphoserine phosphatase)